ncbi:MAG: hypothetical protein WCX30_03910 [Candidatus Paceibacterota bacterium]|jgi:hypothetical protein
MKEYFDKIKLSFYNHCMVYDIEKMSLKGLNKLFQVAEYFKDKAEINGFPALFTIEENLHLDGLSDDDLNDIISGFLDEGILNNRERVNYKLVRFGDSEEDDVVQTNDVTVRINYDNLNFFYNRLKEKISGLKSDNHLDVKYKLGSNIEFDEKNHVLKVGDESVRFSRGISPDVLTIIFNSPEESHYYSEMACEIDQLNDKISGKIPYSCAYINEKIYNKTGLKNFLSFNYDKNGSVKIEEKYI